MNNNPAPYDHIVFTEFDGTEGILVDLDTKKYYQLNETAMLIWKGLEKGLTPTEIATEIAAGYEISPNDALPYVEKAVNDLRANKLIGAK
jgi:hypothetical protein